MAEAQQALWSLIDNFERLVEDRLEPQWARELSKSAKPSISLRPILQRTLNRKVGIAGQEGAGKSTLVNAIVGFDVVPTDENQPGTAVPIDICTGDVEQVTYAVLSGGKNNQCASAAEFSTRVLQRNGASDDTPVEKGSVTLPQPHLPTGLCLIDLPGTDGMSLGFRAIANEALTSTDSVILVVQDRAAGPAARLAQEILQRGIAINAVAINLQISKIIDGSTLRPLPDDDVRDHLSATTRYVRESFTGENVALGEECAFFALHFPSMNAGSRSPEAVQRSAAHAHEIALFQQWFSDTYGQTAVLREMRQLVEQITSSVAQHKHSAALEGRKLDGLQSSNQDIVGDLNSSIEQRRAQLKRDWADEMTRGDVKQAIDQAWRELEPSILELKSRLRELHQTSRARLPESWWSQNWGLKDKIADDLNQAVGKLQSRFVSKTTACVQHFADRCRGIADSHAAKETVILPIDLGPTLLSPVNKVSVWSPPEFDAGPKSLTEYDSARVIQRLLDELTVAELTVQTARDGPLFEAFRNILISQALGIGADLDRRLTEMKTIINDPSSVYINAAKQRLDDRASALDRLEKEAVDVRVKLLAIERSTAVYDRQSGADHIQQQDVSPASALQAMTDVYPLVAANTEAGTRAGTIWERLVRTVRHWFT